MTDNRSTDSCVFERDGSEQATDASPGSGNFLKAAGDRGVSRSRNNCPSGSSIVPLTDSAGTLRTAISDLRTGGTTAGHLGTAWAWYLLSPEWKSVWPAASAPTNYGDPKTIKAAILMTDGVYNTFGGACDRTCSDNSAEARTSQELARSLCRGMRDKGVLVYTVGFMLSDPVAEEVLRDCAGSRFYRAENRETLRRAFSDRTGSSEPASIPLVLPRTHLGRGRRGPYRCGPWRGQFPTRCEDAPVGCACCFSCWSRLEPRFFSGRG